MTCDDLMTKDPACCEPGDTVARAAQLMQSSDAGAIPVVSERAHKKLAGIVTDRDLAVKVVAQGRNPNTTRVEDIMTRDPVCCHPLDDAEDAMVTMARRQIRRIPIIDDQGSLTGIVSQADIARNEPDRQAGAMLTEISQPERSPFSAALHRIRAASVTDGHDGRGVVSGIGGLLIGAGAGAAVMALFDPARGRARRAYVRDKATKAYHDTGWAWGRTRRDLRNIASGVAHSARSAFQRTEEDLPDAKLEARVRSQMGRAILHPHPIHVTADRGVVTVSGPILRREADDLLHRVRSVDGVKEVVDQLDRHETAEGISSLQGGEERAGAGYRIFQRNWSPGTRFLTGACGAGLAIWGLATRGTAGKTAAACGLGMIAQSAIPPSAGSTQA